MQSIRETEDAEPDSAAAAGPGPSGPGPGLFSPRFSRISAPGTPLSAPATPLPAAKMTLDMLREGVAEICKGNDGLYDTALITTSQE